MSSYFTDATLNNFLASQGAISASESVQEISSFPLQTSPLLKSTFTPLSSNYSSSNSGLLTSSRTQSSSAAAILTEFTTPASKTYLTASSFEAIYSSSSPSSPFSYPQSTSSPFPATFPSSSSRSVPSSAFGTGFMTNITFPAVPTTMATIFASFSPLAHISLSKSTILPRPTPSQSSSYTYTSSFSLIEEGSGSGSGMISYISSPIVISHSSRPPYETLQFTQSAAPISSSLLSMTSSPVPTSTPSPSLPSIASINVSDTATFIGSMIVGVGSNDHSGFLVDMGRDLNGDGYGDLIIGSESHAGTFGRATSGEVDIIYGSSNLTQVSISSLNSMEGVRIFSEDATDVDRFVTHLGDINADGYVDLAIGSPSLNQVAIYFGGQSPFLNGIGSHTVSAATYAPTDKSTAIFTTATTATTTMIVTSTLTGSTTSLTRGVNTTFNSSFITNSSANLSHGGGKTLLQNRRRRNVAESSYSITSIPFIIAGPVATTIFNGAPIGSTVSDAGDVNGDGISDLIIGGFGQAFLVLGSKNMTSALQLQSFPVIYNNSKGYYNIDASNSYIILSSGTHSSGSLFGMTVHGVGDVNGDGLADVAVSDPSAASADGSLYNVGKIYVVYGQHYWAGASALMANNMNASSNSMFARVYTINVSSLSGASGFVIYGTEANAFLGGSVAFGDFNGDNYSDIYIGAAHDNPQGISGAGTTRILFGKNEMPAVVWDYSIIGTSGLRIDGGTVGELSSYALAGAGDFNKDGFADLLIGEPLYHFGGAMDSGRAMLIFGHQCIFSSPLSLESLNHSMAIPIFSGAPGDNFGNSLAGGFDVNGDGYDDVIIGAPLANTGFQLNVGISFVVFGRSTQQNNVIFCPPRPSVVCNLSIEFKIFDSCAPLTVCNSIWQFEEQRPSSTSDRICANISNPCQYPLQYQLSPPTLTSNRVCKDVSICDSTVQYELMRPTLTSNRICAALTNCSAVSEYAYQSPTSSSDRLCAPLLVCLPGWYQVVPPTATTNRECSLVSTCLSALEYEVHPPTATSDRICTTWSQCDPSTEYQIEPPTITSDRICSSLTNCTRGYEYQIISPTATSNRICKPLSNCTLYTPNIGSGPIDMEYISMLETATSDRQCKNLSICLNGTEYEVIAPTTTSDRICSPCFSCPSNKIVTMACTPSSDTQCANCSMCLNKKEYVVTSCSTTSDTVCAPCRTCIWGDEYQVTSCLSSQNTQCQKCSQCQSDVEYMVSSCTNTTDTICHPITNCSSSFVNGLLVGDYESFPPTMTSDRVCHAISTCDGSIIPTIDMNGDEGSGLLYAESSDVGSQYEVVAPTLTSNRKCLNTTVCNPLIQFEYLPPTITSDRICMPLQQCPSYGWYEVIPPTVTSDRECSLWTHCILSFEFQSQAPTSTTDRVCLPFTSCTNSLQYQSFAPTSTSDRVCVNATVCDSQIQYETHPLTPTTDRSCAFLTQCNVSATLSDNKTSITYNFTTMYMTPSQYIATPSTATSDRICAPLTVCGPNGTQYEALPPTPTSNRYCDSCLVCPDNKHLVSPCTASSNTVCENCSICQAHEYANYPCSSTSDTICQTCKKCTVGSEYILSPCFGTQNTLCKSCSLCSLQEFQVTPCNGTQDTICFPLTVCSVNAFESLPPTLTSDRVCVADVPCNTTTQYQAFPATSTSGRVCLPIKACQLDEYISTPPTLTSDANCSLVHNCSIYQQEISKPTATSDRICTCLRSSNVNLTSTLEIHNINSSFHSLSSTGQQTEVLGFIQALLAGTATAYLRTLDVSSIYGLPTLSSLSNLSPTLPNLKELVSFLNICAVTIDGFSWPPGLNADLYIHYQLSIPAQFDGSVPCLLYNVGNGKDNLLKNSLPSTIISAIAMTYYNSSEVYSSSGCLCGCFNSSNNHSTTLPPAIVSASFHPSSQSALVYVLPIILSTLAILAIAILIVYRRRIFKDGTVLLSQAAYILPPSHLPRYVDPPQYDIEFSDNEPDPTESSDIHDLHVTAHNGFRQPPPYRPPPPYRQSGDTQTSLPDFPGVPHFDDGDGHISAAYEVDSEDDVFESANASFCSTGDTHEDVVNEVQSQNDFRLYHAHAHFPNGTIGLSDRDLSSYRDSNFETHYPRSGRSELRGNSSRPIFASHEALNESHHRTDRTLDSNRITLHWLESASPKDQEQQGHGLSLTTPPLSQVNLHLSRQAPQYEEPPSFFHIFRQTENPSSFYTL